MEKVRGGGKKILVMRASLARKVWVNIILFLLAVVMIGSGVYFNSQPEWIKRADIITYNKGVFFNNAPPGLLPASEERPEEYPIQRAAAYFQKAASESTDNELRSLALYNIGTQIGRDAYAFSILAAPPQVDVLPQAIMQLAEAVRIDPNNEDAKYNLELLEKVMVIEGQQQAGPGEGYSPGVVEKGY